MIHSHIAAAALFAFSSVTVGLAELDSLRHQPPRWRLVEEWRVGGEPTGALSFLDVRDIELLPNGGFLILEARDQQIHFLDARGAPVRTVGRKGEGPGEFQRSNGFALSPTGQIVISDPTNSRFTLLAANGDLVRTVPISPSVYGGTWDGRYGSAGRLEEGIRLAATAPAPARSARRIWSADFARADTVLLPVCPPLSPALPQSETSFTLGTPATGAVMVFVMPFIRPAFPALTTADGATWNGVGPEYWRIVRRAQDNCADGATIDLRGPRLPVPASERAAAMENIRKEALRLGSPVPDVEKIPRQLPYYDALRQGSAGQIWVERNTAAGGRIFEVFSPNGVLVAEVESALRLETGPRTIVTNDRVYSFTKDSDGLFFLVALRIER